MDVDFLHAELGHTGLKAFRLGLSATYRPGEAAIRRALEAGVNYVFCYGFDGQMIRVLRDVLPRDRARYVVATGTYNLVVGHPSIHRTLEKRLKQLGTDYVDLFLFLGVMRPGEFSEAVRDELMRLRQAGKVRAIGLSTHNRKLAGELAAQGAVDVLMIRYNAAHRGAEQEIFPQLARHDPGVVSYTATRWTYLLRPPRSWPKGGRVPTAGMCYRFVLSNPHVDICMMAPSNVRQLEANLAAAREGPLAEEDLQFMRSFGDAVHRTRTWFT